jgi:hypothetical protein
MDRNTIRTAVAAAVALTAAWVAAGAPITLGG